MPWIERRRDDDQPRFVDVGGALLRFGHDAAASVTPSFLRSSNDLQRDVGRGGIGRLRLRRAVEAGEHDRALDAGDRQDACRDLAHDRVGAIER